MKNAILSMATAVTILAGCSKGESPEALDHLAPIALTAGVQAVAETKAAVMGTTFPADTPNVFGITAFAHATTAPSTDWSATPYFDNVAVNSGAASALTFATSQYYPANGDKVYFYAYAPTVSSLTAGTSSAAPIAAYTITGQEDIMAAQVVTGIAKVTTGTQPQPALAFTHKLMQVRFKIVKDASFETGKKVTEVLVKDVKTSTKLDIATGALTFDGTADQTLSLPITAGTKDEITAAGTEMDNGVMCQPVGADGLVNLKITADGVVYDNIAVALSGINNGLAGTSHLITLTFKRGEITPTAAITDWSNTGSGSADVGVPPPAVGDYYFTDGSVSSKLESGKTVNGVIYYVDAADPTKFKVMALDESSTESASALQEPRWAANNSYVIGSGAQSLTDGRGNAAAIKAAFDNKTAGIAITESTFEEAFPAAAYCYNYRGKDGGDPEGTWYLPSKNDLQYLCCAFNGAPPVTWDSGFSGALTDIGAQTKWNGLLTSAGGTGVTTSGSPFWSSTEESSSAARDAWDIYFQNSYTTHDNKRNLRFVRCVRDL